ncbi:hypothetical protein C8F04DRAFT_1071150 [Mycena alexandri]|uniref:Uncharacterized protein n=1 Tax=Mycena alexandri TaxID=1745969 RepID=A0AAD6XBN0_9AGAR|nr:hypothetical protein C8F04DRAFT_1071150 [Mycena alexandri]
MGTRRTPLRRRTSTLRSCRCCRHPAVARGRSPSRSWSDSSACLRPRLSPNSCGYRAIRRPKARVQVPESFSHSPATALSFRWEWESLLCNIIFVFIYIDSGFGFCMYFCFLSFWNFFSLSLLIPRLTLTHLYICNATHKM